MKRGDLQKVIELERRLDRVEDEIKKLEIADILMVEIGAGHDAVKIQGLKGSGSTPAELVFRQFNGLAVIVLVSQRDEFRAQLKALGVET